MEPSASPEKSSHSKTRPERSCRNATLALALAAVQLASSCVLFEPPEEDPVPSPTVIITAAPPSTAAVATTAPSTSTTTAATTTIPPPSSSTTTTQSDGLIEYLDGILGVEVEIQALVTQIQGTNEAWDNRSETGVRYSATEEALDDAETAARLLQEALEFTVPPQEGRFPEEHRTAIASVEVIADSVAEMLVGLQSADTGQAREAALVGLLTASGVFSETVGRIAALVGGEGLAALERRRAQSPLPETTAPETTVATTATTSAPPPNPGNTKNCADFADQEEAQEWFETYYPHYGDVARIDTNENRIACESLPPREAEPEGGN